jgi:hypothetical protein
MAFSSFLLPETLADLKNPVAACTQEALHAQLRRCVQEPCACPDRVNMKLRSRCRDETRGLDFEIVSFSEKTPDRLEQCGSQPEVRYLGG